MTGILKHNKLLFIIMSIVLIFCLSIGIFTISKGNAQAALEPEWDDEIVIAHITDTHFYPIRYCYDTSEDSEFYDYVHQYFHKMQLESEAVFWAALDNIKQMKPDYLVVSGDNTQDGERQAHIDVANGLRRLQNEIRQVAGMEHFQVFVTIGNHDLYNEAVYDYSDGNRNFTEYVSRKDIVKIYDSLGFPDLSDTEAQEYYSASEYQGTNSSLPYTSSATAASTDIIYQYRYQNKENSADYAEGEITYISQNQKGTKTTTLIGLDVVESNKDEGHVLGATLTKNTQNFLINNKVHSDYAVGTAHHSIIPHFNLQKEIMTGFIINDWVNGADFLADYGMRYVFTGHMHANDIAHHISFNNNQITDIETSANLGVDSNVRFATIKSGTLGSENIQNLYVQNKYITELDISYAIDNKYITKRYLEQNNLMEFVDWNNKKITNYSDYVKRRMFDNVITNVATAYVNPSIIDNLGDMVKDMLPDLFSGLASHLDQIVQNLVSEINLKILTDYNYSGDNETYKQNKLFGFVEELLYKVIDIEVAPETNTFDLVMYCYLAHMYGNEATSFDNLPANIQTGLNFVSSGDFVKELLDIILDKEEGLYFLLEGILNVPLDLSHNIPESFDKSFIGNLIGKGILKYPKNNPLTLSYFILDEVLTKTLDTDIVKAFGIDFDLGGNTILEFLDVTVEDYLTDSLYTGVGGIVSNILLGLGSDPVFDGDATKTLIKINADEQYTYISTPRADIPTIKNGKLPSKVTVTFGADTATTKNFNWFSDSRITDSVIQYAPKTSGDFNASTATTKNGITEVYGHTVGLIDLGIFAQLGYWEAARHRVALTNLLPNTEYYYRVGSASLGYFSEVFTFKTAPDKNEAFEVLLISDPQGFTNSVYEHIGEMLSKVNGVFDKGYDFVIGTGDMVDNSRNVTQFDYYLNTLSEYWTNTSQVVAAGNHDKYYFEMKDTYRKSGNDVVVDEYNYLLSHFNFDMPEQDSRTGAYYAFDYSGVHFTILNTNDYVDNKMSQAQIDWLENDLKSTTKKHKIVCMHKSLYSAGSHSYDKEIVGMRSQLGPIFEENGVHIVFSGHDHTYNETFYLDKDGQPIKDANNGDYEIGTEGILYVNLGSVGNKFYNYVENDEVPVYRGKYLHTPTLTNPTFGKLVYDGEKLYYKGYQYSLETGEISAILPPTTLGNIEMIQILFISTVATGVLVIVLKNLIKGKKSSIKKKSKSKKAA